MRYIHRNEWLAYGLLVVAAVAVSLPLSLFPYRWHTFLHITGAVVFLGNIIVTAAWMLMAERTRSVNVIHFSAKAVIRADLLFTLPGVLLLLMNGFCHGARPVGWVGSVSPVVLDNCRPVAIHRIRRNMGGILIPGQHRMAVFSDPSDYPESPPSEFFSALRKWYFWGALAIALPLCSLYLMVNKPAFG